MTIQTLPQTGSTDQQERAIAEQVLRDATPPQVDEDGDLCWTPDQVLTLVRAAVRAGVESVRADAEQEIVARPSRKQMLEWLDLDYAADGRRYNIRKQSIDYEAPAVSTSA